MKTPAAYAPLLVDYDEERRAEIEQQASRLKSQAIAAIDARCNQVLADHIGLGSSPKAIRLRAFARDFALTQRRIACELYEATIEELERDGEYSDATDRAWCALSDPEKAARLWPVENEEAA